MALDVSLLERLQGEKTAREARRGGGGGSEPPDGPDIEGRVALLERAVVSIDKTLSVMSEQMRHLATKDDVHAVRLEVATLAGKLDANVATINAKLDTKASVADLTAISTKLDTKASITDLATLSGKIDRMALATDLAELKGRVARIPTVPVLTSILVFVSLLFAAATWALRHLPPAWAAALR